MITSAEGFYYLSLLFSVCFVLWLSAAVVIACVRIATMYDQYSRWKGLGEAEHRALVFTPSVLMLAYWADFQRFNSIRNILLNAWRPLIDPISLIHLAFGTIGVAGIMWVLLCAVFGEEIGHNAWLKAILLGLGLGIIIASIGGPR